MEISRETAQESMRVIEQAVNRTRLARDWGWSDVILMVWGAVWIFAFLGNHFLPEMAWAFWMIGVSVGILGTVLVNLRMAERVQSEDSSRIGYFWYSLFLFVFLEIAVIQPIESIQVNAFICLQIMLAYVVLGLWVDSKGLIALGGAITFFVLVGYFLLQPYYYLWMALTGGVTLLGSGIQARLRMRRP
ncbi:MAG: hypothetical protein HUU16_15535 [Candidatus Omnitrophica bacterium]|nr:hypothetical protein [bacterium]NUN97575.1 hypothetical protein [Candidatus Omnitrophota bacterium]